MAKRQTMNVSLPTTQEEFVRTLVADGRYQTASEVIRAGLHLLERTEHRRLVEKWLYSDLSQEELARLPEDLKERVRSHFKALVDEALADVDEGRVVDGPSAVAEMRKELEARAQ